MLWSILSWENSPGQIHSYPPKPTSSILRSLPMSRSNSPTPSTQSHSSSSWRNVIIPISSSVTKISSRIIFSVSSTLEKWLNWTVMFMCSSSKAIKPNRLKISSKMTLSWSWGQLLKLIWLIKISFLMPSNKKFKSASKRRRKGRSKRKRERMKRFWRKN